MKLSRSCLIILALGIAIGLLGAGSVFGHSQPTQSYYGGGYVSVHVYGFNMYDELIPISWAQVTATNTHFSFRAATASEGGYEMVLPVGTYNVTVNAPGYVTQSISVSVSDGSAGPVSFYLEESHIPIPEFPSQMISVILVLASAATLLAKRAAKREA